MVPTPTLTASASNSAISASDKPDSCWRLSAQNQTDSGASPLACPNDSTISRIIGRINAAPSISAASTANPAISELPNQIRPRPRQIPRAPARSARSSQRRCACCQACGCADASTGMPDRLDQARGGGRERAQDADGDAGEPPFGLQRQLARNLRAIEPAQRGRDIGQQRRRDEIAADEPDQAGDQRQRHQLDHQHGVEHPRGDAAGAQRAQHRQPLLEGQADRGIDDEEADEERQQAEGGQVEMKTVGEALQIGLRIRLDQLQLVADDASERLRACPCVLPISSRDT